MTERDYEQEAREQGWNPDPDSVPNWVDARTFVEKGERIAGILKSKVERLESRLEQAEQANKEFGEFSKTLREKEKRQGEARIAELKSQLAEAVTNGDGAAYTKISSEIDAEKANTPEPTQDDQELANEWVRDNPWYNSDVDLQIYADGLAGRIVSEGYRGRAYFNELTKRVKEKFPEKFSNPRRNGANNVESGQELDTPDSRNAHTYENLPAEAKAACDRFAAQGLMTKEDYVKTYEW